MRTKIKGFLKMFHRVLATFGPPQQMLAVLQMSLQMLAARPERGLASLHVAAEPPDLYARRGEHPRQLHRLKEQGALLLLMPS